MPEPIAPPSPEEDLMISPLPPRGMRALARRSLDTVGRLAAGVLICVLAVGCTLFVFLFTFRGGGWYIGLLKALWPFH